MPYSVTAIKGVPPTSRRGIAFLESDTDERVDGKLVFDGLKEKIQRDLRSKFDYWLGGGRRDNYFHGWPNNKDYKHCFVFKWKEAGTYHRLYGFLCHPRGNSDPKFQACVLVLHARKNTEDTDFSLLDIINGLMVKTEIVKAFIATFALYSRKPS